MNDKEKRMCILAYEQGVQDERNRQSKQVESYYRRATDTPYGMAVAWATIFDWGKIVRGL